MDIISTYWYLWLIVTMVGYGYVITNQLKRIKGMMNADAFSDVEKDFFSGMGPLLIAAFVGTGGMIILVISIILHIISYAK
ncbi:MAG: hypothetical protein A2017_16280 [Lentisphaerae bacterium GWF2_44_16]|nr:MAG: hypothetical protein A2017_16280 [Lentisphaerae bacterium GWF2_44_16]HAU66163.1 hypothetical protein [Candidatus Uhrbacteria bacterium]